MPSSSLQQVLSSPEREAAVVNDCLQLIDREVQDKGGLSGMAVKGGYKAVQSVRPGFLQSVVRALLPDFASALDPLYQEAHERDQPVAVYFRSNAGRVADALLAITDAKAEHAKNRMVRGAYDKLRGSAKKHVEAAVPRLGALIERHDQA